MKETARGFKMDTLQNEPKEVQEVFDWYQENFGFVPNLTKVLSESPAALRSYWLMQNQLSEFGLLSPEEHNIIQMAIAVENRCKYCASGHQMAGSFFGSSPEDLEAIRNESTVNNKKFDALKSFTLQLYRKKGRVTDEELNDFLSAGYNKSQAIEITTNIAAKIISNLTNQLTLTELDEPMVPISQGLFE